MVDPERRLGDVARGGPQPIREHPFFKDIEWNTLWTMDAPPLEALVLAHARAVPLVLVQVGALQRLVLARRARGQASWT